MSRVLYLIACASPRSRKLPELIELLHADDWDVRVIATPSATRGRFVDLEALTDLTGTVRSQYKMLGEEDILPAADVMLVCPATFNTINKWAAGIADTLALGLITEAIGKGIPLIAAPALNNAQAAHPAFLRSVETLREAGVTVLYGPGVYEPGEPGTGGRPYDWSHVLEALRATAYRL